MDDEWVNYGVSKISLKVSTHDTAGVPAQICPECISELLQHPYHAKAGA